MRCITCQNLSFSIICKNCRKNLLKPGFHKRELEKGFYVYSFYGYDEIKELIKSKYEFYGDRVFNILSSLSFKVFARELEYDGVLHAVAVDDHTRHHFSQSAILARSLRCSCIKPQLGTLRATNIIKYAGRDLEFRKNNPRKFKYSGRSSLDVVLVDDIVTSGSTMLEAKNILEKNGCSVAFGIVLADAKVGF